MAAGKLQKSAEIIIAPAMGSDPAQSAAFSKLKVAAAHDKRRPEMA